MTFLCLRSVIWFSEDDTRRNGFHFKDRAGTTDGKSNALLPRFIMQNNLVLRNCPVVWNWLYQQVLQGHANCSVHIPIHSKNALVANNSYIQGTNCNFIEKYCIWHFGSCWYWCLPCCESPFAHQHCPCCFSSSQYWHLLGDCWDCPWWSKTQLASANIQFILAISSAELSFFCPVLPSKPIVKAAKYGKCRVDRAPVVWTDDQMEYLAESELTRQRLHFYVTGIFYNANSMEWLANLTTEMYVGCIPSFRVMAIFAWRLILSCPTALRTLVITPEVLNLDVDPFSQVLDASCTLAQLLND